MLQPPPPMMIPPGRGIRGVRDLIAFAIVFAVFIAGVIVIARVFD